MTRTSVVLALKLHWATKCNFFFGTRGKISVPNRTCNAEFKYVSTFSPSPTVFFVTAKLNVKKCIFTYFTGQQNLTYFLAHGEKYLFLIKL
jgi:hypothetical protein